MQGCFIPSWVKIRPPFMRFSLFRSLWPSSASKRKSFRKLLKKKSKNARYQGWSKSVQLFVKKMPFKQNLYERTDTDKE